MFWLLLLHTGSTLFMTGLIWFVQVVHYPLFMQVGPNGFASYEKSHQARTSLIVMPVMLCELITAAVLFFKSTSTIPLTTLILNAILLALIWLSTFLLQVPCHRLLSQGYEVETCRRLVNSNWIRTICWSARSILLLLLLNSIVNQ